MKVTELIEKLNRIENKDAEVVVQHWVIAKKSEKVILNRSQVKEILVPLSDDTDHPIVIDTEGFEEDV
ncbi:hypothetical protein ABE205_19490 [Brevibacillus agri]|uniref:hypothetical protein n=1 Tax=Brevibacillus agri TaxID=51101 RepID=UPI001C8EE8B0|nr:hypothetical protein [Brevibacillus agri]MBY0052292.1 hypothetical protein [Brevibacillus agri]